jgi:hypothetical protein
MKEKKFGEERIIGALIPSERPTASNRPWVSRSSDGLLVLKPRIGFSLMPPDYFP